MSDRIGQFLSDTKDISGELYDIVVAVRELINAVHPTAEEEIKYGGLVFNVEKQLITGIFVRKNHLSLEFSFGAGFADPTGILEGTGKLRRHIKLRAMSDIVEKEVEKFVRISFE